MAEQNDNNIILKVDVDNSSAVESIDQLNDKLKYWQDLQKSATNPKDLADYNQKIKDIKGSIDQMNKSGNASPIKSFKTQLKEAKEEALKLAQAGKENTREFAEAAKKIAELKDQQDILNRAVTGLDVGNRFQAFNKVAGLAASSVAGLTGLFTYMGVSAETANESIAKLQGLQAVINLIDQVGDAGDYLKPFIASLGAAKTATDAVTVSTEGQVVATKGATIATKGLGLAFKALGIGLVVAAVSYLVANFDEIKASVLKVIPSLDGAGETFNKIKNIILGVGNVVVQYLIAPIKAFIALVQGDFKGAAQAMINQLNVVKNFRDGQAVGERNDAAARRKEQLEKELADTEDRIEILKARGKSTEALERSNFRRRLDLAQDDAKKQKEIIQDLRVFEAGIAKKKEEDAEKLAKERAAKAKAAADKIKAERDADEKKYAEDVKAANKIIENENKSARDKEVNEVRQSYQDRFNLANKLGKDVSALTSAMNEEIRLKNKKFDEDELKAKKEAADKIKELAIKKYKDEADAKLIEIDNKTRPNENDTPDEARTKLEEKANSLFNVRQSVFEQELSQLAGNNEAIRLLKAKHEQDLTNDEQAQSEARKAIAEKEKNAKLSLYDAIGQGATAVSDIIGQQTVAGKALAVAGALISTYAAIAGQLAAFSKVPVPGYAIAQAVVTGIAGLAAVKNILSVKVPASGGSGGGQTLVPPTINSTVLNKAANGTGDVQQAVQAQNNTPSRAYIVSTDLVTQAQKEAFAKRNSTI